MTDSELQHALSTTSLSNLQRAMVILWSDSQLGGKGLTTYGLSKKMRDLRIGNPNRSQLEKDLKKSPDVIRTEDLFQIKAGRSDQVRRLLQEVDENPIVDMSDAYIPRQIWSGTRNYIEKVATQLCGCWEHKFYDAAAVMLRRLAETLVIEAYEALGRQDEIKDHEGNYFMLGTLVDRSCAHNGINLGREAKGALKDMKEHGDRSAHNRRINAVRPELERIRSGARTAVEELINIAQLRRFKGVQTQSEDRG